MDELDKKIMSIFKSQSNDYKLSTEFINRINITLTSIPNKKTRNYKSFKIALATCCCSFLLVSGIVLAKEFQNLFIEKFASGEAIAKAAEDGYIGNSNSDFNSSNVDVKTGLNSEVQDTFNVDIKTNDFLVDSDHMSIEFEIKFDNNINKYKNLNQRVAGNEEYIDYENFGDIVFSNSYILDEDNRLIYSTSSEENFYDFCKKHNLNYKYHEFNENYLNTGGSSLITEINTDSNIVKLTYNYNTITQIPKSKKLKIYIKEITFIPKQEQNDKSNRVILTGDWMFGLNMPEIMYNREEIIYNVTRCDNSNFEIYEAKLTNTGFEIGLLVSNVSFPKYPEELAQKENEYMTTHPNGYSMSTKEDFINIYGSNPKYEKLYIEYQIKSTPINTSGRGALNWVENTGGCYVLNSKGEKFTHSRTSSPKSMKTGFTENNQYNYYKKFTMLPDNATDEITVIIDFYGKPVHIELKKEL